MPSHSFHVKILWFFLLNLNGCSASQPSMAFQESISSYIPYSWQKAVTTGLLIIAPFVFTYALTYLKSIKGIRSKSEGIEAPPVPYTIPLLGNVFSFAFNTIGTFQSIM
jgi:hypothetical protein